MCLLFLLPHKLLQFILTSQLWSCRSNRTAYRGGLPYLFVPLVPAMHPNRITHISPIGGRMLIGIMGIMYHPLRFISCRRFMVTAFPLIRLVIKAQGINTEQATDWNGDSVIPKPSTISQPTNVMPATIRDPTQ